MEKDSPAEVIGFDQSAYAKRQEGCSPDAIRAAVWQLIETEVGGHVLDAGSGNGGWIRWLQKSSRIQSLASVDLVDDGPGAMPGVNFKLVDLSKEALPFPGDSLDWISAIEVLEHLANPRNFVMEAGRTLKLGGKFVISTPSNDSIRAKASFVLRGYFPAFCEHDYVGSGHITTIFVHDLRRMAKEAGFKGIEFHFPLPGRLPMLKWEWQSFLPFCRGQAWSDVLIAVLTK